jgi:hypothetical protein
MGLFWKTEGCPKILNSNFPLNCPSTLLTCSFRGQHFFHEQFRVTAPLKIVQAEDEGCS